MKALAVPPLPPLTRDERIAPRTFAFDPFSAAERKRRRGRERREGALNYEPTTAVQNHTRKGEGGREERERDNAMI